MIIRSIMIRIINENDSQMQYFIYFFIYMLEVSRVSAHVTLDHFQYLHDHQP